MFGEVLATLFMLFPWLADRMAFNLYHTFIFSFTCEELKYRCAILYSSVTWTLFEPWHDKTNKMSVRPAKTRSAWASAQSDQSLRCALNGYLRTQCFFMRTAKILIKLGGRPGWSESSLGAHSFCWFYHVAAHFFSFRLSPLPNNTYTVYVCVRVKSV